VPLRLLFKHVRDSAVTTGSSDLESLYRERGDALWWSVLAFTGDRSVADDAVAEAFAQALRRGQAIRAPERWIWRAAFCIAGGMLKDRRTMTALQVERVYEMPEPVVDLLRARGKLSPKQRASVILHHLEGYPVKEIATILASTSAAVRVHLSSGRKRLRELLGDADA